MGGRTQDAKLAQGWNSEHVEVLACCGWSLAGTSNGSPSAIRPVLKGPDKDRSIDLCLGRRRGSASVTLATHPAAHRESTSTPNPKIAPTSSWCRVLGIEYDPEVAHRARGREVVVTYCESMGSGAASSCCCPKPSTPNPKFVPGSGTDVVWGTEEDPAVVAKTCEQEPGVARID